MNDRELDDDPVIRGSDDFLADQAIADPDEFRVKSHLCHEIATIAEQWGLTAAEIGLLSGEAEQDVERMMNYRHNGCEVWRLIKLPSALGADVSIYVNRESGNKKGIVLSQTIQNDNEAALCETGADGRCRLPARASTLEAKAAGLGPEIDFNLHPVLRDGMRRLAMFARASRRAGFRRKQRGLRGIELCSSRHEACCHGTRLLPLALLSAVSFGTSGGGR
jgi:hypothetical protein